MASLQANAQEENYPSSKQKTEQIEVQSPKKENTTTTLPPISSKKWDWTRARIGGNFGLQIGTYSYVNISPTLGYYLTKKRKIQVGGGPIFIYSGQSQDVNFYNNSGQLVGVSPAGKSFVYGGNVFIQYHIAKGFFANGNYTLINKDPFNPSNPSNRINVSHLLFGVGYRQNIGDGSEVYLTLSFNLLDNPESLYRGTFGNLPLILGIGIGIGGGTGE